MAELFLVEAVNDALHTELARDDSVMVLGQDVGRAGGVFRATAGLRDRFGPDRCVDTPLSEAAILGTAIGLCIRAPELHDDSPEAYYAHTPGVKVAIPATPADAKGLLVAAIRDPDPVVVLEPKLVYRTSRGEVPAGEHVVPLGQARLAREGSDVTLVAYGAMVPVCEAAADALDGASAEVLD